MEKLKMYLRMKNLSKNGIYSMLNKREVKLIIKIKGKEIIIDKIFMVFWIYIWNNLLSKIDG